MLINIAAVMPFIMKGAMFDNYARTMMCMMAGVAAYFTPVMIPFLCCVVMIFLDTVYGYRVSKLCGNTKIESRKLWKTITKLLECFITVCAAYMIDESIFKSVDLHAVEVVCGIIAATEFWSILESQLALRPNGPWRLLKHVIRDKSEKYLKIDLAAHLEKINEDVNKVETTNSTNRTNSISDNNILNNEQAITKKPRRSVKARTKQPTLSE